MRRLLQIVASQFPRKFIRNFVEQYEPQELVNGAAMAYTALGLLVEQCHAKKCSFEAGWAANEALVGSSKLPPFTEAFAKSFDQYLSKHNPYEVACSKDLVLEGIVESLVFDKGDCIGATVVLTVLVPPARFLPHYEFFRQRIVCDGMCEKMALAKAFAQAAAFPVVSALDKMTKLVFGRELEFHLPPSVGRALRLPPDVEGRPPARIKKLELVRSEDDQRWKLHGLVNAADAFPTSLDIDIDSHMENKK